MKASYDVVALIFGVLLTCMAGGVLWYAWVGPLNWGLVKIIAPLALTAVGILGLALSRNKPQ